MIRSFALAHPTNSYFCGRELETSDAPSGDRTRISTLAMLRSAIDVTVLIPAEVSPVFEKGRASHQPEDAATTTAPRSPEAFPHAGYAHEELNLGNPRIRRRVCL